jgi:hypothetical protein
VERRENKAYPSTLRIRRCWLTYKRILASTGTILVRVGWGEGDGMAVVDGMVVVDGKARVRGVRCGCE